MNDSTRSNQDPSARPNEEVAKHATAIRHDRSGQRSLESIIRSIDLAIAGSPQPNSRVQSSGTSCLADSFPSAAVGEKYIVFTLAEAKYAIAIGQVKGVSEAKRITPVPNVPDWVLGVTNLRGNIVSVVDCGAFLNLTDRPASAESSMCVVSNATRDLTTTLMVDNVEGLCALPGKPLMDSAGAMDGPLAPYLQGVYEHEGAYLTVLDLDKLLAAMAVS